MAASRSVVTESRGDMRCRSVVTEQKRAQHGVHLVSVEESGSESGSDRCPREERHHRTTKPAHVSDQHEAKKDKKKNEKKKEKKKEEKKHEKHEQTEERRKGTKQSAVAESSLHKRPQQRRQHSADRSPMSLRGHQNQKGQPGHAPPDTSFRRRRRKEHGAHKFNVFQRERDISYVTLAFSALEGN